MENVEPSPVEPWSSESPGEYDLRVCVPKSAIKGDKTLIPGVTKYKQFPYAQRARCTEQWCQNHVFVVDEDGPPGWHVFWFTKDRGDDGLLTPIFSRTENTVELHEWHPVLFRMGFIEDKTQPLTLEVGGKIVEIPRLFGRFYKLPGGLFACRMRMEVFLSPRKFPDTFFKTDVPVPTTVSWSMRNSSDSITCLHPRIRFPETQSQGTVLSDAGTIEHPIVLNQVQDFPATNHVGWRQHVCDERVQTIRGVRQAVRITVWPPKVAQIKNSA